MLKRALLRMPIALARTLSQSPQLLALSNAQRQEMAEDIAYQVVLGIAAKREYVRTGDHDSSRTCGSWRPRS